MQPLYEVTLARPWHWGIAIVSTPNAAVPETLEPTLVTATPDALVIKVRHAQDIEAEVFEGDWDWATAAIHVRSLTEFDQTQEPTVFEGLLQLPTGDLSIGDADSEVRLTDLSNPSRVRVYAASDSDFGATSVRIDLAPSPNQGKGRTSA
jgi:hypothetical protein